MTTPMQERDRLDTTSALATAVRRVSRPGYGRWLSHVSSVGGCVRPGRLFGQLHTVDTTTGQMLSSRSTATMPDGVVYVPCGDRRASVCPPCAETYRADTYQLIKAGLVGGKGVPESVGTHPAIFATLTAPSFGPCTAGALTMPPARSSCAGPADTPACARTGGRPGVSDPRRGALPRPGATRSTASD